MASVPTRIVVQNEGCNLHCWFRGDGPMILFVPGENGHGRQFDGIMNALADRFTCVTFDRRQMSASQVIINRRLNPPQQARDMLAIIHALGFSKAIVFGSGLGGLLGYTLALNHPDAVQHLIVHEAPSTHLLPDASRWVERWLSLLDVRDARGSFAADAGFRAEFVGFDEAGLQQPVGREPENVANLWENEFLIAMAYAPDLHRVRDIGTSIGIMTGVRSGKSFAARGTFEQARILDCPRFDVPGHHLGFEVECDEFVPHLLSMIDALEESKAATARAGHPMSLT